MYFYEVFSKLQISRFQFPSPHKKSKIPFFSSPYLLTPPSTNLSPLAVHHSPLTSHVHFLPPVVCLLLHSVHRLPSTTCCPAAYHFSLIVCHLVVCCPSRPLLAPPSAFYRSPIVIHRQSIIAHCWPFVARHPLPTIRCLPSYHLLSCYLPPCHFVAYRPLKRR